MKTDQKQWKSCMQTCRSQACDVIAKMKDTHLHCDLGMNLEVSHQSTNGKDKQWKTQKNCDATLFDLAIVGCVVLAVMAIGSCVKRKCRQKPCKDHETA